VSFEWDSFDIDRSGSLQQAVELWIWLLESGFFSWDKTRGHWASDYSTIPLFVRLTDLC
jgi:hypothetical protein